MMRAFLMSVTLMTAVMLLYASPPAVTEAATTNVAAGDFSFSPNPITITAGDTVAWSFSGTDHTVTSGTGAPETFDSGLKSAGGSYSRVFNTPGTYNYYCTFHGTAGNGFALLKAFARTGDERWLERARRFAVHALAQAERIATANGRRRYSLFTGDVGTALFAAACLDVDPRFPIVDVM